MKALLDIVDRYRLQMPSEVALMLVATAGFLLKSGALLLSVLFLLGLQSTLFGPLKYGILPQVLSDEELTGLRSTVGLAQTRQTFDPMQTAWDALKTALDKREKP